MAEENHASPFVIFNHGTPTYPPNDLHDQAEAILAELARLSPVEAVKELTRYRPTTPFTWYPVLGKVFAWFNRSDDGFHGMEEPLLHLLKLMSKRPAEPAWRALRDELLQNIDAYSGWSFSWQKEHAEQNPIRKGPDGHYMTLEDGTVVRVMGAKTFPETRLDFICDAVLRPYGRVRQILDVFSVFAISDDFALHPEAYPPSLRLVLGDHDWYTGRYPWHRMHHYLIRTSRWRPYSNLCDPVWLGEELMARISSQTGDGWKEDTTPDDPWLNHLDAECTRQLDCALDTDLFIGDEDEVYFKFEGRTFRWINGTPQSSAILSIGVSSSDPNYKPEYEAINRLFATLVWRHNVKIGSDFSVGGARRALPYTYSPRLSGGTKIGADLVQDMMPGGKTDEDWLALALYKEGRNADSVFYRFFNYWKVLEVAMPDWKQRAAWIEANASRVSGEERLPDIGTAGSLSEYLYDSGRCAIAHVSHDPFVNPDKVDDRLRISRDEFLVGELARLALREVMGVH